MSTLNRWYLNLDFISFFIGQSNMAGRGYITDNYKSSIKDVYLLTPTGTMEQARNPFEQIFYYSQAVGFCRV